ncbi:MAG: phosphatidylserine decarboxylase [Planctomycetota bacterium]|nr:MAG: phosphatidylserine decarboxylase [Planctomycetota bacterium]
MSNAPSEIRYRDRQTGELRTERVFGERELRWFYGNGRVGRWLAERVFARPAFNHLYGLFQRSRFSRRAIPAFVERLGVDVAEAERPVAEYSSLDAFFARRLRPGVRPLDPDPDALLSPADGRALAFEAVGDEGLRVKRSRVGLEELLGDAELARRYWGGGALVVRLAPVDYHRFHFPADGVASPSRRLGKVLHSVHPLALAGGAPSFRNKREVALLESERFGALALVEVGAMIVGSIEQTYRPGPVRRGEEKGCFHLGGSTVVVLTEPGRVHFDEDLLAASREELESYVRMGSRVGVGGG